jgi:hypothetical protein
MTGSLAIGSARTTLAGIETVGLQLGELRRRLPLPQRIVNWSLTSLQQRLVKTGGAAGAYYWLLLAEGHLNRRRFGADAGQHRSATATEGTESW